MTLKEKIQAETGQREYDDSYTCPVLGPISIQSLTEAEYQDLVLFWCYDQNWERIPERRKYENARLVQVSVVDLQTRNRVFTDSMEDLEMIAGLRKRVFQPLYERVFAWQRPETPKNAGSASGSISSGS